MRRLHKILEK